MNFKKLHQQESPLIICNVWDVPSAQIAQKLNFQAIGTSSGAIASLLGYPDGEHIDFQELLYLVRRITTSVKLPLTVDLEAGYSRKPGQIVENILKLVNLGVVGINLEDSLVDDQRSLVSANTFSQLLEEVHLHLKRQKIEIFLNIRTDPFLLNCSNPLEESIKRAQLYQNAGADGLFVPGMVKPADIQAMVQATQLPVNVMTMPELPSIQTLQSLGVKRISMGNFAFSKMHQQLELDLRNILHSQTTNPLFV